MCAQSQVRFALSRFQQFQLTQASLKRDLQSPRHGPDRDYFLIHIPGQNAVVVSNCPEFPERPLYFPVEFISIADFTYAADDHLSGEFVFVLRAGITKFVQCELSERFCLPCPLADPVATGVRRLYRVEERSKRIRRRNEFDFCGEFHYYSSIEAKPPESKPAEAGGIHLEVLT